MSGLRLLLEQKPVLYKCANQLSRGSASLIFIHFASLSQYFNFWYFGIFEKPIFFVIFCLARRCQKISVLSLTRQKRVFKYNPPDLCDCHLFCLLKRAKVLLITFGWCSSWVDKLALGKRCTYFNLFIIANKKISRCSQEQMCVCPKWWRWVCLIRKNT